MTDASRALFGSEAGFFRFVREERHFCAVLGHLLMQRNENVRALLILIGERLEGDGFPPIADLQAMPVDEAEVYLEFSFLRDRWNQFDLDQQDRLSARNAKKRALIFELLARVPSLASLQSERFPSQVPRFNAGFMGEQRGLRVAQDIASPALWSVRALLDLTNSLVSEQAKRKQLFRDLCKFKWAFRIKPDMVIAVPGMRPLCIEAKLMSPEGHYPTSAAEAKLFDELFEPPEHRVRQIELQDFLFRALLQSSAHHVLISRGHEVLTMPGEDGRQLKIPGLSWRQVFARLDWSSSIPSVIRFRSENVHIQDAPLIEPRRGSTGTVSKRNFDGVANGLDAILALILQRQQEHVRTEVGFTGGKEKLAQWTIESLVSRTWKWCNPDASVGKRVPKNWIDAIEFESIVERLRQEQTVD